MTGPELDTYLSTDEMPDNAAQLATVVQQGKFYASRCEQNSRALLPYVGTQNAARDLDVLRAALGQSRLTYLGKSYGTYLGTWYAQLFPHRVRALVLDGAVDPDTTALQADVTQAEGFQTAFGSFAAWCRPRSGCPGWGGRGMRRRQLEALIVRANSRPLSQELGTGQVASGALLLNGVAAALYSKSTWPDLKDALVNAFNGDGTVLVQLANLLLERNADGTYANLVDANTAISCVDRPWPRSLAAGRRRRRRPNGRRRCSARRSCGATCPARTGRCRPRRWRRSRPRARPRSWWSGRPATRPRRTAGRGRWPPTCPPACCSAGTATATPPTARAAPAWTRS